jgi:hypothetical protein
MTKTFSRCSEIKPPTVGDKRPTNRQRLSHTHVAALLAQ